MLSGLIPNEEYRVTSPHTISVHAGKREGSEGIVTSIEPSSAFRYLDSGEQLYPRFFNTPNQQVVVDKLCALEGAQAGILFASGMAAISATLMSLARPGDHVVLQNALYGGTHAFVRTEFTEAGIEFTMAASDAGSLLAAVRENTKVIHVETPANPRLEVIDLAALSLRARQQGLTTVCDNTFASPINQRPVEHGIDVVVHSGTKYLSGHSDLSFGAAVGNEGLVGAIRERSIRYGANVNALTCYLIERSMKTLAIRVSQQNTNAERLAAFLESHASVARVHYPGLASHPQHAVARRQMNGFGGMLSFELVDAVSPKTFLQGLKVIAPAMSLGGIESTATIPAYTSHKSMNLEERQRAGVADQLIRLSVGIESVEDLMHDIDQALRSLAR